MKITIPELFSYFLRRLRLTVYMVKEFMVYTSYHILQPAPFTLKMSDQISKQNTPISQRKVTRFRKSLVKVTKVHRWRRLPALGDCYFVAIEMGTTPPSDLLMRSQRPPRSLPSSDDYVPIRRDDFKRLQTHFHQRLGGERL